MQSSMYAIWRISDGQRVRSFIDTRHIRQQSVLQFAPAGAAVSKGAGIHKRARQQKMVTFLLSFVASLRGNLLGCWREAGDASGEAGHACWGAGGGGKATVCLLCMGSLFGVGPSYGPSFHRTETKPSFVETSFNLNGSVRKSKKTVFDGPRRLDAGGTCSCDGGPPTTPIERLQ